MVDINVESTRTSTEHKNGRENASRAHERNMYIRRGPLSEQEANLDCQHAEIPQANRVKYQHTPSAETSSGGIIELHLATWGERFVAWLIDVLVIGAIVFVIRLLVALPTFAPVPVLDVIPFVGVEPNNILLVPVLVSDGIDLQPIPRQDDNEDQSDNTRRQTAKHWANRLRRCGKSVPAYD